MQVQTRVASLDLLKGLVMIVMALDHVRNFTHASSFRFDPADMEQTTPAIFFTRWITHFCAPTFSLLAGTSAYLAGRRKTKAGLAGFLLKRGLWLVLLEVTVLQLGWRFTLPGHSLFLITIWALGLSMIVLAGGIYLPRPWLLGLSLALIAGHNLLDPIFLPGLHQPTLFMTHGIQVIIGYPVIPWIAIMALGYCLGPLYETGFDPARRRRILAGAGAGAVALFLLLTWLNIYGDPFPRQVYPTLTQTVMSFFNRSKYPPSLQYLLMTIGPALLLLAASENWRGPLVRVVSVFGRVPFFYYIAHIYLIHVLAAVLAEATGFGWQAMQVETFISEAPALRGYGFSLPVVYLFWLGVVAALYPLCLWFDGVKRRNKHIGFLSYL